MSRMMDPPTSHKPAATLFEQACRQALVDNNPTLPGVWQDLRQDAYVHFERLGLPSYRQEAWKYTDLRAVLQTAYQPVSTTDTSMFEVHPSPTCGVWVMSLKEAWQDPAMADRLVNLLRPSLTELDDAFAMLALALATDGLVIHAPKGACTEGVLDIGLRFPLLENAAHHALVVLLVDDNAELHMRVKTQSQPGGNRLLNVLTVADVASHARFHSLSEQHQQAGTTQLDMTLLHMATAATVHQTVLDTNGYVSRHAVSAHLDGEQANLTANVLSLLHGESAVHHHTAVHHHAPDATSQQLIKGIVDDAARLDFAGTIFVDPHAQGTNAAQLNKHLMLSDRAKVYTRPQLRIDADDVKCTHGASIGQLDEEALFYLISRGLSPRQARQLLTDGFSADVLNQLPRGLCVVSRLKPTDH
jgi:Fe-S cluster assembly protein SufD